MDIKEDEIVLTIDSPDDVDKAISEQKRLKEFVNLKYQVEQIKARMTDIQQEAMNEYSKVFGQARSVKGKKVELQMVPGPCSWEFSDGYNKKKNELDELTKQEKKDGTATQILSDKTVLKVKFHHNEIKEKKDAQNQDEE